MVAALAELEAHGLSRTYSDTPAAGAATAAAGGGGGGARIGSPAPATAAAAGGGAASDGEIMPCHAEGRPWASHDGHVALQGGGAGDVYRHIYEQYSVLPGAVVTNSSLQELRALSVVGGGKVAYAHARLLAAAAWKGSGLQEDPLNPRAGWVVKQRLLRAGFGTGPGHYLVEGVLGQGVLEPVRRGLVHVSVRKEQGQQGDASSQLTVVGWKPLLCHEAFQDIDLLA